MRRSGFTLIELLMVIAVIGLLAVIFYPALSSAGGTARTVVCQTNLRSLSQAFSLRRTVGGADPTVRSGYPLPQAWPTVPMDILEDKSIYICPEDDSVPSGEADLSKLEYHNPHGVYPMTVKDGWGASDSYVARRGTHPTKGPYTEFHCEDDNTDAAYKNAFNGNPGPWRGWFDCDCFIRVYDNGELFCFETFPWDEPEYMNNWQTLWVVWPPPPWPQPPDPYWNNGSNPPYRLNEDLGDYNRIYWEGAPAFGEGAMAGNPTTYRGQTHMVSAFGGSGTSYGINSYAYDITKGKFIVLVDYEASSAVVWLEDDVESEANLLKSGRHRGNVNYLMSDGTVHMASPFEISPRLAPEKWNP
jgi:prepilin-type N-terminal cleavage/methylation domain-containing protein